ncbi:hypothetical protein ACEE21_15350 [Clostridium baratii]
MDYREKLEEVNKMTTNLEYIEDIVNSLKALYSEDIGGIKRLPDDLVKYSSTIFIAYTQALLLLERLKENKVYEVIEYIDGKNTNCLGVFSSHELAREYKNKNYKKDRFFYTVVHKVDEKVSENK